MNFITDGSSPDLIVHGVLDHKRSMEEIREDLKSIMERLVRPYIRVLHITCIGVSSDEGVR